MLIQHKQKDNHEMYFIEEDGDILAEIIYVSNDPNTIIIEHTEVSPELKGQNVGFQLVNHVVEHARTHGMKIVPVCTFARSVFDKKPDFSDVLAV
ncbi:MAG TPA: GNAT family N-acetyltransferase [Chitinophagaceae bacterium]